MNQDLIIYNRGRRRLTKPLRGQMQRRQT